MGPSWCVFVCGDASRAIFLAKQKNFGWSVVSQNHININDLYCFIFCLGGHLAFLGGHPGGRASGYGSFLASFHMRGRKPRHFFSETEKIGLVTGHIKI